MQFNNLGFSVSFTCEVVESLVSSEDVILFTWFAQNARPTGGPFLRVAPQHGPAWIGWFAPGFPEFPSGAYACPSGRHMLVVSGGNGYVVDVAHPANHDRLQGSVFGVARVPDRPVIIGWTEQDLFAYDEDGQRWWIDHLAEDELRVTSVADDTVHGYVPDLRAGVQCAYTVDVRTGDVQGGWQQEGGGILRVHRREPH